MGRRGVSLFAIATGSLLGALRMTRFSSTGCAEAICLATGFTIIASDSESVLLLSIVAYAMLRPKMRDMERKEARFTVGLGKRRNLYNISV